MEEEFAKSIRQYPLVGDAIRAQLALNAGCEWCDAGEDSIEGQCKLCKVVAYCSKECQKKDWEQGGHREECEAIRLNVPWSTYDEHLQRGQPDLTSVATRHLARMAPTEPEPIGVSAKFKFDAKNKLLVSKNERSSADFATMMTRRAFLTIRLIKAVAEGNTFEKNQVIESLKLNSKMFTARFGVPNVKSIQNTLQLSDAALFQVLAHDSEVSRTALLRDVPAQWGKYWVEWSKTRGPEAQEEYASSMKIYLNRLLVIAPLLKSKREEEFYQGALDVVKLAKAVGEKLDKGVRPGHLTQISRNIDPIGHEEEEEEPRRRHRHQRREYIVATSQKINAPVKVESSLPPPLIHWK